MTFFQINNIEGFYIMEIKNKRIGASDIILVVFGAVFFIGILTFFGPCGPKDDGSWMTCHWAGQAATGLSAVLLFMSVVHIIVKNPGIKTGLSIAVIPTAILAILIPGNIISMCMMNTMRCHAVMKPGVVICSALMILAAGFDIFLQWTKSKK